MSQKTTFFIVTAVKTSNLAPVKYEQGFYIPEDGIPQSHCRENLKSYLLG
jgi:hypothetical protein